MKMTHVARFDEYKTHPDQQYDCHHNETEDHGHQNAAILHRHANEAEHRQAYCREARKENRVESVVVGFRAEISRNLAVRRYGHDGNAEHNNGQYLGEI